MTFDKWYAQQNPDLDPRLDDAFNELRSAYEAGAASQGGTLRDEFAGQALISRGFVENLSGMQMAIESYHIADAMLEARKTPTETKP